MSYRPSSDGVAFILFRRSSYCGRYVHGAIYVVVGYSVFLLVLSDGDERALEDNPTYLR